MANRSYSDRTFTATTDPITGWDLLGMSNTDDGGSTYNLSKKITVDEFVTYLSSALGVAITADFIAVGNGTGVEDGTGKANGIVGDEDALYIAQQDFFNSTDYGFWQGDTGDSQMNAPAGGFAIISISNSIKLQAQDGVLGGVALATSTGDRVSIGQGIVAPIPSRLHVKGTTDDDTANILTGAHSTDPNGTYRLQLRNDGLLFLGSGTGVDEFSTDGTLAGDSDDAVPTEKAVKTYVDANTGVTAPSTKTPSGTTETIDWDDGTGQIIDLGSATGDVTLTLNNPVAGQAYMLQFIQGATPRDIVLPSSVLIAGGSAPTTLSLTVIDDAIDTLTLWWNGTNYIAQFGENYG